MKIFTIIIFCIVINFANAQEKTDATSFLKDVFYNLPLQGNKISITKSINLENNLSKALVTEDHVESNILNHPFLRTNPRKSWLIAEFFLRKLDNYKIILIEEKSLNNAITFFNLISSINKHSLVSQPPPGYNNGWYEKYSWDLNSGYNCYLNIYSENQHFNLLSNKVNKGDTYRVEIIFDIPSSF